MLELIKKIQKNAPHLSRCNKGRATPDKLLSILNKINLFIITSTTFALSSCVLLSPTIETKLHFSPGTPKRTVFTCTDSAILDLKSKNIWWDKRKAGKDFPDEEYESSHFRDINTVGIFTHIIYSSKSGNGNIKIIARGPYFSDIGTKNAAFQIKPMINRCVENTIRSTP